MPYQYITDTDAKSFTPAAAVQGVFGTPRRIESITIHHWGDPGQRFEDVVRFLAAGNNGRQSSAHYVAEENRVACLVAPADAAWHAGNAYGNATSIGIECRPEATPGDYATVAELIAALRAAYGNLPLIPHLNWTPTACPGRWDLDRLDKLARDVAPTPVEAPAPVEPVAPAPAPTVGNRRWIVDPGDTLGAIAAHYGFSAGQLATANNIADPDRINVGDVLVIPNGGSRVWTVDPGDTLGKIAGHFGSTVELIAAANNIADPDRISVGAVLQVP